MPAFCPLIIIDSDIYLEKIQLKHARSLFLHIDSHRKYLSQFVNWTAFNTQLSDTEHFVKKCEQDAIQGLAYVWAVCVEKQAVGTLSFNAPIDWQNRTAYIGYWLSPQYQGQGIMTRAIERLIESTEKAFNRYILKCAVHNLRSNAVAKRCGFEWIAQQENAEKIGDTIYAQNLYQKLK